MNIETPSRPKVALIAGPTASGKSALAIALAERHGGTVINADSAQIYADLRVLSARPTIEDEKRVPHRLFGHVDGAEDYSAARWAIEAKAAIRETLQHDRLPILVGGTGMYLRTLLDGIAPVPEIDAQVRAEVRALPVAEAHARLAELDPEAAARLRPSDTTRVARALEVIRSTGRTLKDWQADRVGGIAEEITLVPLILLPDRAWLTMRCDARFAAMLEHGAEEEVRALTARTDIPPTSPVRQAIGAREISAWQAGELSRDEAIERAQAATRQYAKRQYTWFRHQPPDSWTRTDSTEISKLIHEFETKLFH